MGIGLTNALVWTDPLCLAIVPRNSITDCPTPLQTSTGPWSVVHRLVLLGVTITQLAGRSIMWTHSFRPLHHPCALCLSGPPLTPYATIHVRCAYLAPSDSIGLRAQLSGCMLRATHPVCSVGCVVP